MLPDFNRLNVFYHVFRCRSIVLAAEALFITQSAVSQNLKKLEQEMNIALFTRLPKRLLPTPAGEQLFQTIMPFYSTLSRDIDAIHSADKKPYGLLRIGAPAVFGSEILPQIIASFQALYPEVRFQLTLGQQSLIASAFRNGELDIALVDIFGNREEASWNLVQEPLLDEPLILVASSDYTKKHLSKQLSLSSLTNCRYIAYQSQAPELTDWFKHHFNAPFPKPDIALTVENVRAVISAVRHRIGLGIVPLYMVQAAIRQKELVHIRVKKDEVVSRISLLRHAGKKESLTETTFIRHLKQELADPKNKGGNG